MCNVNGELRIWNVNCVNASPVYKGSFQSRTKLFFISKPTYYQQKKEKEGVSKASFQCQSLVNLYISAKKKHTRGY